MNDAVVLKGRGRSAVALALIGALAGPAVHDDVENEQDAHNVKDQWNQQYPVFKGDLNHGHDDGAFFPGGWFSFLTYDSLRMQ